MTLRTDLERLPAEARVPVGWVRDNLGPEADCPYISVGLTAEKLGKSEATIRNWCRRGVLRATKAGRAWQVATPLGFVRQEPFKCVGNGTPIDLAAWRVAR